MLPRSRCTAPPWVEPQPLPMIGGSRVSRGRPLAQGQLRNHSPPDGCHARLCPNGSLLSPITSALNPAGSRSLCSTPRLGCARLCSTPRLPARALPCVEDGALTAVRARACVAVTAVVCGGGRCQRWWDTVVGQTWGGATAPGARLSSSRQLPETSPPSPSWYTPTSPPLAGRSGSLCAQGPWEAV